jgi:two-component system phosphate regulon sensor histidine kinase PhoR
MQKDFINNMTHEFKTPISSIKLSSDMIQKAPAIQSDQKLKTYVGIIQDQNQRLNRQVEQVLSMAKLENDQFQLQKEDVRVQSILSELKQAHQFRIESQGGQFTLVCEPKDILIKADRSHFFNLLNNLVDNAVKYSDTKPVVTVVVTSKPDGVSVEVIDQGKGMEPQQLEKITEKFYRIPQGNVHDVKGFGLGLYYVKNICKAHKWDFEVSSKKGVGTKCLIFIPA